MSINWTMFGLKCVVGSLGGSWSTITINSSKIVWRISSDLRGGVPSSKPISSSISASVGAGIAYLPRASSIMVSPRDQMSEAIL